MYENYDRYLIVPVLLLVLSFGVLGASYISNGEFVRKGLDFTGGTEISYSIDQDFTAQEIEQVFAANGRPDVSAVKQVKGNSTSLVVNVPPPTIEEQEAESILNQEGHTVNVQSVRSISASVSSEFFLQAQLAFLMAFTIMSLVIFYAFKDLTPSMAVIFAAASDIIFSLAGMSLLGIPLTLGSFAALLMLIGYSVDTDIVLSTRVLKRKRGKLRDRVWSSMTTGVTMSSGGIAGFTLLYIASWTIVGPSELSNIAAVMVIGLLADMPFTWFGNAIILKKYVEEDSGLGGMVPWI